MTRAALLLALVALAACPQERPEAAKQIPPQRVPPAMTVEPAPADGGPMTPLRKP